MSDRVTAVLLVFVLTGLMVVSVVGHGPLAGPKLFTVSDTHGVNLGDLLCVAAWAVGVACCWRIWQRGAE